MTAKGQGDGSQPVDLPQLVARATNQRIAWAVQSADLNVNLIVLQRDERIEPHRNDEVDVLIVGIDGIGEITIDGTTSQITPDTAVIVPKGTARALAALEPPFAYLTCHRHRKQLWPTSNPARSRDREPESG